MIPLVRTLWGGIGPGYRWSKIIEDVRHPTHGQCSMPTFVYCYGTNNANLVSDLRLPKCEVVLVNPHPFPNDQHDIKTKRGWIRPWTHKIHLLQRALDDHGQLIYADWDVFFKPSRPEFVQAMFDELPKHDFLLSFFTYWRAIYRERPRTPDSTRMQRSGASGNWMYLRGREFIDEVDRRMDENNWHDEWVMSRLIDEMEGGFCTEERWLERYESPYMKQKNKRRPWHNQMTRGGVVTADTPVPFEWYPVFQQV